MTLKTYYIRNLGALTDDCTPTDYRVNYHCVRLHDDIFEDDRINDAHPVCDLGMRTDRHIRADFGAGVHLCCGVNAHQPYYLLLFHGSWIRQNVLVNPLIVPQVDLLNMQKLFSLLDLLPEMLLLVHDKHMRHPRPALLTSSTVPTHEWIDEIAHLDMFGAIVDLELIGKLVEELGKTLLMVFILANRQDTRIFICVMLVNGLFVHVSDSKEVHSTVDHALMLIMMGLGATHHHLQISVMCVRVVKDLLCPLIVDEPAVVLGFFLLNSCCHHSYEWWGLRCHCQGVGL